MVYVPAGSVERQDTLVWLDHGGGQAETTASGAAFSMPRLSPDNRRVAVALSAGNAPGGSASDIWVYDLMRATQKPAHLRWKQFVPVVGAGRAPVRVQFLAHGPFDLYVKTLDDEMLRSAAPNRASHQLSVVLVARWPLSGAGLGEPGDGERYLGIPRRRAVGCPAVSPDSISRRRAHVFSRWPLDRIRIRTIGAQRECTCARSRAPAKSGRFQPTAERSPCAAKKAGLLFYRRGNAMMVVDIATAPGVAVGKPRRLFEEP